MKRHLVLVCLLLSGCAKEHVDPVKYRDAVIAEADKEPVFLKQSTATGGMMQALPDTGKFHYEMFFVSSEDGKTLVPYAHVECRRSFNDDVFLPVTGTTEPSKNGKVLLVLEAEDLKNAGSITIACRTDKAIPFFFRIVTNGNSGMVIQ